MLRRLQKMICAMMIALLLVSAATPAMAKTVTAKVSSSSAKIYSKASTSAKSAKLKKGASVKVTAVSGSWAKVKVNGRTGYVKSKYLSSGDQAKSASTSRRKAYVSRGTYVYRKASSSSSRRSVSANTKVYVVGKSGSYYKVQNASGSS